MATNDEIRLKLTASKMNIHRSTKLETIATQRIVRNLDSFLDLKYVMLLPIALRNIVLQHWLMRRFAELKKPQKQSLSKDNCVKILAKRMKVFQSLVSCHTLEVDPAPFINDSPDFLAGQYLWEYLNLIGAKAPNLKVLIIKANNEGFRELDRTLCDAIGKFRNLISLDIFSVCITYRNLKKMCKNLKSLSQLSTRIHFRPFFDVSIEREIEELQIFSNLILLKTNGQNEEFRLNCIQHLPKLRSIDNCTTSIVEQLLDRCPDQKFALTSLELTAHFNKEIHLNFPDVTDLEVCHHYRGAFIIQNSLLKLSKIGNLTLRHFPSVDTMIPFLDAYGHGLHSLKISFCMGHLKLSSILDRCPKLQSLLLDYVSILPECSRPDVHSFPTGLKELYLFPVFGNGCHALLLLDILSVPTLECVTLEMNLKSVHLEDIEKLTAMVASRQILGNLKRLKIFVHSMNRDSNHRVFYAFSDFIKSASAFLPHLTDLKTNIPPSVQVGLNSEASLEVATLKKFVSVFEN